MSPTKCLAKFCQGVSRLTADDDAAARRLKKAWECIRPRTSLRLPLVVLLLVGASAFAGDLTGRVMNGTTKKPVAGIEVVVLTPSKDGMDESARARTDGTGRFRFSALDSAPTHVLRVSHQGATYHKVSGPSDNFISIQVYDVAPKLDGVFAVMDVQRFEATSETLIVKQLITVRNESNPPRTLMDGRTFEIQLPTAAQVKSGLVQVGEGQPLKENPSPGDSKGQYYFTSPIRPGDTRFAVVYQVPYDGKAVIEPTVRDTQERFVIMLPRSMTFQAKVPGVFRTLRDVSPDNVQETAAPLLSGQTPAFVISGTGTLEEFKGGRQKDDGQATRNSRPGGGLGAPIGAPPPLQNYRWQILAGFSAMLLAGATYVTRRKTVPYPRECQSLARPISNRYQKRKPFARVKGRSGRRAGASQTS
jgi:Carboxypeptidase regulatory-like domain